MAEEFTHEYAPLPPLSPDEKDKGLGYYLSKLFKKKDDNAKEDCSQNQLNEDSIKGETSGDVQTQGQSCSPTSPLKNKEEPLSLSRISVLKKLRRMMMDKSVITQQYKDSEFRQHWLPDRASRECSYCQEKFTTFRRRHHCGICGQIFCSKCCYINVSGKLFGYEGELRTCLHCCKVLFSLPKTETFSPSMMNEIKSMREKLRMSLSPECLAEIEASADESGTPLDEQGAFKKSSYGFIEENYASKAKFEEGMFDSSHIDKFSAERALLLKDSHQLHNLCSLIFFSASPISLNTHRHRLKSFPNSFIGKDLVRWLLDQNKASSKQSAIAIGQAILEAGLIVCVSQQQQCFLDDYIIYQPVKQAMKRFPESCEAAEEPLWVKEIPTQAESENKDSDAPRAEPKPIEIFTSLSTSSSNYCLDLNVKESVVSMKNPKNSNDNLKSYEGPLSLPYEVQGSSVSSALSKSALPYANEQLYSSLLMAKEVQEAVRCFETDEATSKTSGWLQHDLVLKALETEEKMDDQTRRKFRMQKKLQLLWTSHETDLLAQLLSYARLPRSWVDIILPVIYTVSKVVSPDVKNDGDEMDIRRYVHFKKIPHQEQPRCDIVNGVVCSKNVIFKAMPTNLTNPYILLISSNIHYQRGSEVRLINIENVELQEREYFKNVVSKILALKPKVILVEKSVSFIAMEMFRDADVALVTNIKPSIMERISRCTQSQIVSSVDAPIHATCLGMCHNFYLRSYGDTTSSFLKTLMFFDGCATHLGCTVMLKGSSIVELKKVKSIMLFMIYALYNWKLERSFHMDEQAFFPNLFDDGFKYKKMASLTQGAEEVYQKVEKEKADSQDSGSLSSALQSLHLPQEKTNKESVSDYSDPLHQLLEREASPRSVFDDSFRKVSSPVESLTEQLFLDSLKATVLSVSPMLKYRIPYLFSENGKKSLIRKYYIPKSSNLVRKGEFTTKKVSFPSKNLKDPNSPAKIFTSPKKCRLHSILAKPHTYLTHQVEANANDPTFKAQLADFRARGGMIRNICSCQDEIPKNIAAIDNIGISKVIVPIQKSSIEEYDGIDAAVTQEGELDPLHPYNHQQLSVLFSVYSHCFQVTSTFCVNPWIIGMQFYGKNDIPLGAFLESYCFRTSYSCPSTRCTVGCVSHIRKFAHLNAEIEVSLKQMDNSNPYGSSAIYISSWCEMCSQGSSFVPMSSETWAFSFAKYLELRFYESTLERRIFAHCSHMPSHCFVKKNIIAAFKYIPISVKEVILPPTAIAYTFEAILKEKLVETINNVSVMGYSVFSTIHEHLVKIGTESNARWTSFIVSLDNQYKQQRSILKETVDKIQLKITEPILKDKSGNKSQRELAEIIYQILEDIIRLKSFVIQVVAEWNAKIQEFLQVKKKDEKMEKLRSNVGKVPPPQISPAHHQPDSASTFFSFHSDELSSGSTEYKSEEMESIGQKTSGVSSALGGSESKRMISAELEKEFSKPGPLKTSISSDFNEGLSNFGSDNSGGVIGSVSSPKKESSSLHSRHASGGLEAVGTSSPRKISGNEPLSMSANCHERSFSDTCPIEITKEILEKSPERRYAASSVKNILTNFWSSSADLMVKNPFPATEHYFISETKIPLAIYEKEPSSIIAYALASHDYEKLFKALQKKRRESPSHLEYSAKVTALSQDSSLEGPTQATSEKASTSTDEPLPSKETHFELQWSDQDTNFYCKIYFPEHFYQMRALVFSFGEDQFIRSLTRCVNWEPKGGKSGSLFCKTTDERFILKEMSKSEKDAFLEFGSHYVKYVVKSIKENQPTALTKIVGAFRIVFKNNASKEAQKMDILVMENLFYQKNIKNKYDLKGSVRNRLVDITGKEDSETVLMDENLLKMSSSSSLYLRSHCKEILMRALERDSTFLSQQLIMDYSLLVGIDENSDELIVGIIDYIRTFTWDKELESRIKVLGGTSGKLPTVISPELYRSRFCEAMERYFSLMPDKWYEFASQLQSNKK